MKNRKVTFAYTFYRSDKTQYESLFNMLDNHVEDDDIQDSIEKCILTVCEKHKIEKERLLDYIELEVREQLKQTIEV